jgi:Family of unknown function (DUF5565)
MMKKVPSLFQRDWNGDRSRVTSEVNPVCQWVIDGEGIPTQKHDGTACRIVNGNLFVRFDAKNGKPAPANFEPAQDAPDPETGHWPGWVPAGGEPQYKWQRRAFEFAKEHAFDVSDGTYEACGPHFQGNPEGWAVDNLIRHGSVVVGDAPRTFAELAEFFKERRMEGIVWHHPDGRMAKIKAKDFGVKVAP